MSSQPELKHPSPLDIEVIGANNDTSLKAVHEALDILAKNLSPDIHKLISGTKITIGDGLTKSGGKTNAEDKQITLDATKNAMSLSAAEEYLVGEGYLNPEDWTRALPETKDQEWSCLTYQLVHEFGHLVDGLSDGEKYERLDPALGPTKLGKTNPNEAFAEAFAYQMFGLALDPKASLIVEGTLV